MTTDTAGYQARHETITLTEVAPGTARRLQVYRYGLPGARPKVYLQAGLHADELPGMLALHHLLARLDQDQVAGRIQGEIVVVPVANPIGLSQTVNTTLLGRYEIGSGSNFNRDYPDLAELIGGDIAGRLGTDAQANIAAIRAAMAAAIDGLRPESELAALRLTLLGLNHDADYVLDLHADTDAELHLYMGPALWPDAGKQLAADMAATVTLLAEISGGNPFDEAVSGPWWALAKRFPDHPIPPACFAATVELRGANLVEDALAASDAAGLHRFLQRRGVIAGDPGPLPAHAHPATPLAGLEPVKAPVPGLIVYRVPLGAVVSPGTTIAEMVDPTGGRTAVTCRSAGRVFARTEQRFARPGYRIAKIASAEPLPERTGKLLGD